ncbi:MAG: hypothetical protein Q7S58_10440 [Candidatus Binatus sp.]|uniref:hypothetical protein n=1 Tax=Candidatus Binatus sp. TaxID=2811406 RepID=UPI002721F0A0|nr:hypothetical protein [Candidatus Binatus sp.]MDO8432811.1 hypothetical protein [Candidatus Binatus sp.]
MTARNALRIALVVLFTAIPLAAPTAALAHVGSADVFYEGDAGPYHLIVTVVVPQVIPGVAEVQVRSQSNDVKSISTSVTRLSGPGSNLTPVPDLALRSPIDPHLFTSSLWLMEYGSMRVRLAVSGARGGAEMSVPVPSFARQMLPMPRWLGALLLALVTGLALGAISIIGAAARDSKLPKGSPVTAEARRSGRRAMLVAAVIVSMVYYFAFVWWGADDAQFARITRLFKPPKLALMLDGANHLAIRAADSNEPVIREKVMPQLIPDHGHLMHLFMVRAPGLDRMWHLHPEAIDKEGAFAENLPSIEAGHYQVFADVVDKSGFPWTLVGAIDLPQISGAPLSGDDSSGRAEALAANSSGPIAKVSESGIATDVLADGTRVLWRHEPLRAKIPMLLQFIVQDKNGEPARDLEPYMGMAAHAEIVASDLSVFAHIHPSGSVPMAALMMASADAAKAPGAIGAMKMPAGMAMREMAPASVAIAPNISMPYGFPKPGLYRIFFQFKRGGRIETAVFDARVN